MLFLIKIFAENMILTMKITENMLDPDNRKSIIDVL